MALEVLIDRLVPRAPVHAQALAVPPLIVERPVPNLITSASAFRKLWNNAKKPASQMIKEMVLSFSRRSTMLGISSEAILSSELRSTGVAYCAEVNQMNTLRQTTSPHRLATKLQRILLVRG